MPCNPTNASTLGALSSAKLGTLGAASSTELQGTLGVANSISLCSSSSRSVPNTQGLAFGTYSLASKEPTKKRNKEVEIKKILKEKWAAQFPWAELVVDPIRKTHIMCYKVCSLVQSKDKILNPNLDGLHKHAGRKKH